MSRIPARPGPLIELETSEPKRPLMCPLTTPVRLPRDTFICRSSMHDCGLVLTKSGTVPPGPVTSLCRTRSSRSRAEMCSSEIDPPKRRQQALNDARVARCLLCLSHLRMLLRVERRRVSCLSGDRLVVREPCFRRPRRYGSDCRLELSELGLPRLFLGLGHCCAEL